MLLLFHLKRVMGGARQPHAHIVAEVKGPVVPPTELDRPYRQVRPLRKLFGNQLFDEGCTDFGRFGGRHRISASLITVIFRLPGGAGSLRCSNETAERSGLDQIMIMKRDGFQVSARKLRSGIDLQQPEYPHYGGRYRADDGHIE